jgi:hypothetical protein
MFIAKINDLYLRNRINFNVYGANLNKKIENQPGYFFGQRAKIVRTLGNTDVEPTSPIRDEF